MTATKPQTPAEVLRAAADYIDEHGWTQGEYIDDKGRCCALGAVGMVADNSPKFGWIDAGVMPAFSDYLDEPVSEWNDRPRRTKDQVTAMLREVAASLDVTS